MPSNPVPPNASLNPRYSAWNLAAYNFAGFACISLAVFLSSSQPFFLSDVIGVDPHQIGHTIGSLTIVDELTAIVVAPLLGTLVDWVNAFAWNHPRMAAGPRVLELAAFAVIGASFLAYGRLGHRPSASLYVFRAVFAVGMSGVMSVAVVMLHEASNSDFEWRRLLSWRAASGLYEPLTSVEANETSESNESNESNELANESAVGGTGSPDESVAGTSRLSLEFAPDEQASASAAQNGKLSALLGVCTGAGAIFSVSFFLTLPVRLAHSHPEWSSRQSLQMAYSLLGGFAVLCGFLVYFFGYDCIRRRRDAGKSPSLDMPEHSYWNLMRQAIQVSRSSRSLQLAYTGGFVARAATVTSSMFVPLMVYQFYTKMGLCGDADKPTSAGNCYNAYVFSAILTGVASTVSLLLTPVWGIVIDARRYGCRYALEAAGALGAFGCFMLCAIGGGTDVYDPRNAWCFIAVCCMGTAQIGVVISSMSLVTRAGKSLQDEHQVIGSITGLYSLSGGVGILLVAKVGGSWSDRGVFGPFLVLGALYSLLFVAAALMRRANDPTQPLR